MIVKSFPYLLALTFALASCGGGGGGGSESAPADTQTTNSTLSFSLQRALQGRAQAGYTDEYSLSGTCTGTAILTASPLASQSFEGTPGFSTTLKTDVTTSNCSPANFSRTSTGYLDTSYRAVGMSAIGSEYAKTARPTMPPESVKVGDQGTLAEIDTYTDSTKSVATGRRTISYSIEADTSTTAIVVIITTSSNLYGQTLVTQQARFQIDGYATLSPLSIDVQYSTTSEVHLAYTIRKPFPLRDAYAAKVREVKTENFVLTGTITGTAAIEQSAPVSAALEGNAVRSYTETKKHSPTNLTDNTPFSLSETSFINASGTPIGISSPPDGTEVLPPIGYAKSSESAAELPAKVKVGDSGTWATLVTYASSGSSASTGQRVLSYEVEADTDSTVIVNLRTRSTDVNGTEVFTQNKRYRLDAVGTLTTLSIAVSYPTVGFTWTYTPANPVNTSLTFPLKKAYDTRLTTGSAERFTVTGTCSGTAELKEKPPTATVFEGLSSFFTVQNGILALTSCEAGTTPTTVTSSGLGFYDNTFTPIGSSSVGLEYAKFTTAPRQLPNQVKVGDVGTIVQLNTYTNNTKTVSTGRKSLRYTVAPDTATTAIVTFITESYDTSERLLSAQKIQYRIDAIGRLTVISIDTQNSTTNNLHLVYTPVTNVLSAGPQWPF